MTQTKNLKTLYVPNRSEWRKWLEQNFETEKEIWLVFPNKWTGKASLVYNDAVEEALCFDWIDSTVKAFEKGHKIQRFTPRKPKSAYSQANKERLKRLLETQILWIENP
jgi:uncharacterized protein YdeI (YjbR/CyaY-like superfamily)